MQPLIKIEGPTATLLNIDAEKILRRCAAAPDPKAKYNRAFVEERWDGIVPLYEGNEFPAGLYRRVQKYIEKHYGVPVRVMWGQDDTVSKVDPNWATPDYLAGIRLWEHQTDAIRAILTYPRLCIKSGTGSGKTEMMVAAAQAFHEQMGWRTLVVVPSAGLLKQTVNRFRQYYDGAISVGQCGDGKKTMGVVTVATAATLIGFRPRYQTSSTGGLRTFQADPKLRKLVKKYEVLMFDECHHTSASTWYEIAMESRAIRRIGFSGTPLKGQQLLDLKLIGATGPCMFKCNAKDMVANGTVAKPKIVMVMSDAASAKRIPGVAVQDEAERWFTMPAPYADAYVKGVVESKRHNRAVVRSAVWLVDHGRQTLVLCRRKSQFLLLKSMLEETGIAFMALWGDTHTRERESAKRRMAERKINLILATTIFDEGEDVKAISGIVLAEGIKATVNAVQRVGRGMRQNEEGDVWVVDFVPTCHYTLMNHAMQRCEAWEKEGYEVGVLTNWPPPSDTDENLLPFRHWDEFMAKQ